MDRIILIGYRGAGKTTIGKILAGKLNYKFIDLDEEIIKNENKTIPEIVKEKGWQYFRKIEKDMLKKNILLTGIVISAGGGIIETPENVDLLKQEKYVIWLEADIEVMKKRISASVNRPSLTGDKDFLSEMEEVFNRRKPLYEAASSFKVNTNSDDAEKNMNNIMEVVS